MTWDYIMLSLPENVVKHHVVIGHLSGLQKFPRGHGVHASIAAH